MTRIMVVDDNKDIAQSLATLVEKEGYETDVAFDGSEFLSKVEEMNPELVLLDVMMPGLNTKEVLDGLKEKELENLKIILVTVVRFSEEEISQLMDDFCIVDYITKPFDVFDVPQRVRKALLT